MKIKTILFFAFVLAATVLHSQDLQLTFTSATDAKFFVYLNGKLQNEKSTGMVTIKNLEDKDYHVRIVIDDPFEVAVTRTIRPDRKHNEYSVKFNAVRERVYLKSIGASQRDEGDNNLWVPQDPTPPQTAEEETPRHHSSIKRNDDSDTANRRIMNRVRTQTIE